MVNTCRPSVECVLRAQRSSTRASLTRTSAAQSQNVNPLPKISIGAMASRNSQTEEIARSRTRNTSEMALVKSATETTLFVRTGGATSLRNIPRTGTMVGTAAAIIGGTDIVAVLSTVTGSSSMSALIHGGRVRDTMMATLVTTTGTNRSVRLRRE